MGVLAALFTTVVIGRALLTPSEADIRGAMLPGMSSSLMGTTMSVSPTDEVWLNAVTFTPLPDDLGAMTLGGTTAGTTTSFGVPYGGTTGGAAASVTCGDVTDPRVYDVNPCRCARDDADVSRLQGIVASLAQNALKRVCDRVYPGRNDCPAPCIKEPGVDPNPYVANAYGPQVALTGKYAKGTPEYRKVQCGSTKNLVACFRATGSCDVITECRTPIGTASSSSSSQFTSEYWCCKPPEGKTSTYCTQRTSCYYEGEVRSGPFTDRTTCEDGCEPLGLFKCCANTAVGTCVANADSCAYGMSRVGALLGYRDCKATCSLIPTYNCCERQTTDGGTLKVCKHVQDGCPAGYIPGKGYANSTDCVQECPTTREWTCCSSYTGDQKRCEQASQCTDKSFFFPRGTFSTEQACQDSCKPQ